MKKKLKVLKLKKNNTNFYFNRYSLSFLSYKNINLLKKFVNSDYRIISSKSTNVKKFCQNKIKKYIKYSKYLGILPYVLKINF